MKNCVLWVGNGFTISLTKHLQGATRPIDLFSLFPPPEWTCELRSWDKSQSEETLLKLMGKGLFGELQDAIKNVGGASSGTGGFADLCVRLGAYTPLTNHIGPADANIEQMLSADFPETTFEKQDFLSSEGAPKNNSANSVSFQSSDVWLQLRQYIWQLIRNYDREINCCAVNGIQEWPWLEIMYTLVANYRVSAVSYNYDVQLEKCFGDLGVAAGTRPGALSHIYDQRDRRSVPTMKPHGSSSFSQGVTVVGNVNIKVRNGSFDDLYCNPDLVACPLVPFIVPPGYPRDPHFDALNPTREVIHRALSECDVLVVCGYSASGPDHDEFKEYLTSLRGSALVMHAGAGGDEQNNAARSLQGVVGKYNYHFYDPSSLNELKKHVSLVGQL
ncbi:MAG: hypothetical protein AAGA25_09910 [Planctomycetota bacterium]